MTVNECPDTDEFDRLAHLVQQVTGWRDSPAFRGKLKMILGGDDEDTASTWLRRLGRRHVGCGEWQMVIERLMVPETFFFRDGPQLDVLRYRVLPEIIERKRRSNRTIRLWSAGCSSGEEPYTLAMLTLDALMAAGEATELPGVGIVLNAGWVVHVQGTDLNPKIVEKARVGLYSDFGLSPFRETPPEFRRFFVKHDSSETISRFGLRRDVRSVTSFGIHNLKEAATGSDFDLVSCRNVLIYFDDDSKAAALEHLTQAVGGSGFLMLGPTDPFDRLYGFQLIEPKTSPILAKSF
ncbi:MAG TPA: CheR family methyltransferase [Candidatus Omnitrophota bacterium]|nr:CheR family methyltransferase [Candidatus Omnitrophota bacterium]